jgi:hypothetical protein
VFVKIYLKFFGTKIERKIQFGPKGVGVVVWVKSSSSTTCIFGVGLLLYFSRQCCQTDIWGNKHTTNTIQQIQHEPVGAVPRQI